MAATNSYSSTVITTLSRALRPSHTSYICAPCIRHQQQHRNASVGAKRRNVPEPRPFVPDVQTFLTLIGRNLSSQASKFVSWHALFTLSSAEMKELGVEPAKDRRYLLRWIDKYRKGQLGPGGDFKYVKDGVAELAICEVPSLDKKEFVSANVTPGMTKLVLNVPSGKGTYELEPGQTTADLKKPKGYTLRDGMAISGPFAIPAKAENQSQKNSIATVKVQEGMWEDRLGKKVFGGERRRAQVLHKLGVEEHRKAIGATR